MERRTELPSAGELPEDAARTTRSSPEFKPKTARVAYSCVIDQDPILLAQCFIWLNCLIEIQSIPSQNIFIHMPDIQAP